MERMYNPPHPSEVLKELWLDELSLTITETARALGVSRAALSEIINGRRGISANMAHRLGKAFRTSPEVWINLQRTYDLWKSEQEDSDFLEAVNYLVP